MRLKNEYDATVSYLVSLMLSFEECSRDWNRKEVEFDTHAEALIDTLRSRHSLEKNGLESQLIYWELSKS